MNIKVEEHSLSSIQIKIDQIWSQVKKGKECDLNAKFIMDFVNGLEDVLGNFKRNITDYNDALIKFRYIYKDGYTRGKPCINFSLRIEDGEFYLIELILDKVSPKLKNTAVLLMPEYLEEEENELCTYKHGEIHGVKIVLFKGVARLRFAMNKLELDYKIGGIDEFLDLIENNTQNLTENAREILKGKLRRHIRLSRIKAYVD